MLIADYVNGIITVTMAYEDEHFIDSSRQVWNYSFFSNEEIVLFQKGQLFNAYDKFGSHYLRLLDTDGFYFAVWAPNAVRVAVIGEFNGWKKKLHPLFVRSDSSGIWEGFIPRLPAGALYKYHITDQHETEYFKADPYAFYSELRPGTASITRNLHMDWNDGEWMLHRKNKNALDAPWSVYEMHLGSWMRPVKDDENKFNTYHEIRERLVPYIKAMGFTHVEFMPVMEFPYDGSWGYQGTGYFSATSRFGVPEDFMYLVDVLHQNEIGVILDWVPSHFPADAHGLFRFDGAGTYEYEDMRKGFHPDWNSYIFNYSRGEVRSFLLSSAHFWMHKFHADGLRVDAVNSIIRLDFSRAEGAWEKNIHGGNENLEAIEFLKHLNQVMYREFPGTQTIAEEASDWPGITKPISENGFGFGFKWMMGWMHDMFRYFKKIPEERVKVQDDFTFSMMYFYDENFMLPLSHDEVVHGKSPMIYKMPGNEWEQFANLRLLYGWMYLHPGAKLLFMGNEFGQTHEWDYKSELQWELLQYDSHNKLQEYVRALNHLYRNENSLYHFQFERKGFEWICLNQKKKGILGFKRKGKLRADDIIVYLNVINIPQESMSFTIKGKTHLQEILNSDDAAFWGSGKYMNTTLDIQNVDKKKRTCEIKINLPPLGLVVLK